MTPFATLLMAAAVIVACSENAVQAGIGAAILVLALAAQIAGQAGMFLPEAPPPGRPAESFEADPREG